MCEGFFEDDSNSLEFGSDWFVTRGWMGMWHDDYYDDDHWHDGWHDTYSEWYDGYEAWKAQKAKIKEEFRPVA